MRSGSGRNKRRTRYSTSGAGASPPESGGRLEASGPRRLEGSAPIVRGAVRRA